MGHLLPFLSLRLFPHLPLFHLSPPRSPSIFFHPSFLSFPETCFSSTSFLPLSSHLFNFPLPSFIFSPWSPLSLSRYLCFSYFAPPSNLFIPFLIFSPLSHYLFTSLSRTPALPSSLQHSPPFSPYLIAYLSPYLFINSLYSSPLSHSNAVLVHVLRTHQLKPVLHL